MFKLQLLTLCLCTTIINCYVEIETRHKNADIDSCLSTTNNLKMSKGEERDVPGKCLRAFCEPNGDIIYHGCGSEGLPPNCTFIEPDMTAPYPQCCRSKYVCN